MQVPWPFRPIQIAAAAPTWFAAASVRMEDGPLVIGDLVFTGIEATLTTDAWTGSYVAAGMLQFSARPWHFTARLTRAGSDGSAGLDVSLDGRGPVQGIGARLSGQIRGDGTFGGRVTGRGPDLSQLLPAPAVPFSAAGRVNVADGAGDGRRTGGRYRRLAGEGGGGAAGVAGAAAGPRPGRQPARPRCMAAGAAARAGRRRFRPASTCRRRRRNWPAARCGSCAAPSMCSGQRHCGARVPGRTAGRGRAGRPTGQVQRRDPATRRASRATWRCRRRRCAPRWPG